VKQSRSERAGRCTQYRVALVIKPDEAEARRFARHPRVVDVAAVAKQISEVSALCLWRQVPNEDLTIGKGCEIMAVSQTSNSSHIHFVCGRSPRCRYPELMRCRSARARQSKNTHCDTAGTAWERQKRRKRGATSCALARATRAPWCPFHGRH